MLQPAEFIENLNTILNNDALIIQVLNGINSSKIILHKKQLIDIYEKILLDINVEKLSKLENNQSIIFSLERSCIIIKSQTNGIELILMPNSKYYEENSTEVLKHKEKIKNKHKIISVAYRIHDAFKQEFRIIKTRTLDDNNIQAIEHQLYIEKKLPNYVHCITYYARSSNFGNKDSLKIYLFSEYGISDLFHVLTGNNLDYINTCKTPEFITKLIKGVIYIHEQGIVHGDIKLENIILYNNKHISENNLYSPKYIDFEASRNTHDLKKRSDIHSFGTIRYWSPQLLYMYANMNKAINSHASNYTLDIVKKHRKYNDKKKTEIDFADDSWALGLVIYNIITSSMVYNEEYTKFVIENNRILNGLLHPDPKQRFTAKQTLGCWMNNPTFNYYKFNDIYVNINIIQNLAKKSRVYLNQGKHDLSYKMATRALRFQTKKYLLNFNIDIDLNNIVSSTQKTTITENQINDMYLECNEEITHNDLSDNFKSIILSKKQSISQLMQCQLSQFKAELLKIIRHTDPDTCFLNWLFSTNINKFNRELTDLIEYCTNNNKPITRTSFKL